jgi:hypothetical protein
MKHMDWYDLLGVLLIFFAFILARISLGELERPYPKPEYSPFDFRQIKDVKLFSLAFILLFIGILLFFVDPET